jgi:hypothetical protein
MAKKLFEIDPDSEVKGNERGQVYVTTTPDHPSSAAGKKMPDHKKTYVPLCVVVMENHLGRLLKEDEEVHHKDENQKNNALSNLELKNHDEHQISHAKKRKFWKKSPLNKPSRKHAMKVVESYLSLVE